MRENLRLFERAIDARRMANLSARNGRLNELKNRNAILGGRKVLSSPPLLPPMPDRGLQFTDAQWQESQELRELADSIGFCLRWHVEIYLGFGRSQVFSHLRGTHAEVLRNVQTFFSGSAIVTGIRPAGVAGTFSVVDSKLTILHLKKETPKCSPVLKSSVRTRLINSWKPAKPRSDAL